MAKYLFRAAYTAAGAKGLLKDGGTARQKVLDHLAQELGGELESMYWGFGGDDVYLICTLPDDKTAAALSMTVAASGAVSLVTVPLLTAADIDEVSRISVAYRPPGS